MLNQKTIENVEGRALFNFKNLYRFYFDSDNIADNMLKNWKAEPGDPLDVSIALVEKVQSFYCNAIVQDEEGDNVLDVDLAL